jgi:hypothetical protein
MHYTLFLLLFHFTPTRFKVRNVIFREFPKFLYLLAGSSNHLTVYYNPIKKNATNEDNTRSLPADIKTLVHSLKMTFRTSKNVRVK